MRKFFLFVLLCAATAVSAATKVETFTTENGSTTSGFYMTEPTTLKCAQASWTVLGGGIKTNVGNMGEENFAALFRAKRSDDTFEGQPYIMSDSIEGGIDSLWFSWNSNGTEAGRTWNVKVYVNDVEVGAITEAGTDALTEAPFNLFKNTTPIHVDGKFVIKLVNLSSVAKKNYLRLVIDDLSWEYTPKAGEKQTPEFAFEEKAFIKKIDADAFTNTLTNTSDATPTFESTKPAVATVDAAGKVTIGGVGETTITASVAETETYKAAEASYTLRVVPTNFNMETFDGANNVDLSSNNTYLTTPTESFNASTATGIKWTTLLGSVRNSLGGSSASNLAAAIRGKKTAEENYGYLLSSKISGGIDSLAFEWNANGSEASRTKNWDIDIFINDTKVGSINDKGQAIQPMDSWFHFGVGNLKIDGDFTIKIVNNNVADDGTSNHYRWVVDNIEWYSYKAPEHTYSVVGPLSPAGWDEKSTAGDMTLKDGVYSFKVENVELVAGTPYEYKIVEDHAWAVAYPQTGNATFTVDKSGKYNVTFTLNASSKEYAAVPELIEEIVVVPTVAMHGNFLGNWADTENFTVADDKKTASIKLTIEAGNYEFGMRIGSSSNWTSNGVAFTRENNAAKVVSGEGNLTLAADAAGEYTFTWTYETENLAITFPEAAPELPYMAIIGEMNGWAGTELVPAEDKLTASATIHLDMNVNSGYGFKVLIGDKAYCIEPGEQWYSFNRGWTSASGIDHVATDEEAFWLSIDKAGDYTFTWTIAEKKLDITFPELLNITYYFVNTPDWEKVYAYAWDPQIAAWPGEEATVQQGVSKNGHNVWAYTMPENRRHIIFNDGTGGDGHQTANLTVEDGKPYFNDGTWYATLDDVPTAIENTVVGAKVQKLIENGQVVIIRNGEKFNAQGQLIR